MKLSTRSRYGTRLLLDMAQHYNQGAEALSLAIKNYQDNQH